MAFKLEREKTNTSPYVLIDEAKGYMKLEGKSYLDDIIGFFGEIHDWLENYLLLSSASGTSSALIEHSCLTFDCAMEYFNSSTTKMIYNMLRTMDKAAAKGAKITVNWITYDDDDMIIECGEDFKEDMEHLTFNLVVK